MNDDAFDLIEQAVCVGGAESGFDLLAKKLVEDKNYPLLFEVRVVEQRHKMGLPPLRVDGVDDIPSRHRDDYEETLAQAAREVGSLFLSDGDIPRAWPYFRAIGERELVCAAIEKLESAEDAVIQMALEERVHPRKGFELLLGRYGICRAITYFEQYSDRETREQCIVLLVRTLHRELIESLQRAIVKRQPGMALPHLPDSVPELIRGRDWLFGDLDYYVDTSHLVAVIRFALDLADTEALRLAIELCEYGKHLSTQFKYRAEPPFDDVYVDHAAYLSALAGENVDACIQHFLAKVRASDLDTTPAQVLVALLTRLKRYQEAIDISLEHLSQTAGEQLVCPTIPQLCQLAGDYARLKQLARERGDLLSFMAATLPRPTVS